MLPEIKFSISQNNKVMQTVNKAINGQDFVKSLEDFQAEVNAVMTKMIEDLDGSGGDINMDEDDEESDEEEEQVSCKKKKNS